MIYQFILTYTPTDGQAYTPHTCHPDYSNDLAAVIEMQADEWYRTRKLDGRLTFRRDDYTYIVDTCPFDGSFLLTVQCSTDGGITWHDYLSGTFSRANLEIDEDNRQAVLSSLTEGGEYKIIENGKDEEYDLMKIIPDSDAREVQGQIHPALAIIDRRYEYVTQSDIFCDAPIKGSGLKPNITSGYSAFQNYPAVDQMYGDLTLIAEAKIDGNYAATSNLFAGTLIYDKNLPDYATGPWPHTLITGRLTNADNWYLELTVTTEANTQFNNYLIKAYLSLFDANETQIESRLILLSYSNTGIWNPTQISIDDFPSTNYTVDIRLHYILASLLTLSADNGFANVFDTGEYYKAMQPFNGIGLTIYTSVRTVNQPNGHALVSGTGYYDTTPQYFAPPDDQNNYIPLAEDNWSYASMWYTITPSTTNGLLAPANFGSFRWTRCWSLGTCLNYLLQKITDGNVSFDQSLAGSEFLYSTVNPVTGGEPFSYLFTQKSNVMRPSNSGSSAARCIVRLKWFLELLRNAFNCYWFLTPRNGGGYNFRVEHVEWFRRGGSYTAQITAQINLAALLPRRNYQRDGLPAKHLDDQQHRYTYDMNSMTEKYTFSWQGEGGSDAFKGHPMFFKAGWIERGTTDDYQVDNIFADLPWLMLNAGSDTASSKNYEGLFIFSGYIRQTADWTENHQPLDRYLVLAEGPLLDVDIILWCSAPAGHIIRFALVNGQTTTLISEHTATGNLQPIAVQYTAVALTGSSLVFDFGTDYADVFIHRIHARGGYIYNIPNTINRLSDPANPTYMQNGALAWPYLQCEHLHFNIPAAKWSYDSDDIDTANFNSNGTVKMVKKQNTTILPLPTNADEQQLDHGVIGGLRDSQGNYLVGIVENAKINLTSRNCELKIMYDIIT